MKGPLSARTGMAAAPGSPAIKLAAARAGAPVAFDRTATAAEVACGELRRLLAAWRVHEPEARSGRDPEALHQLRVTARRIDATLGLFKHQLPESLAQARRTTKSVLRTLGAARDLDVQLAALARYCLQLPGHEREAAEPLKARLEAERVHARTRMMRALDSQPTRHWLDTLTLASLPGPAAGGASAPLAMTVMPARVRARFRKLRKSVRRLNRKSSMEDFHLVRRRAKQLRYAIESGVAMFGKPAEDELKALRRLQEKLGAHQDGYMARNRLAALAADPVSALPADTLFLMGRLAEHHSGSTTAVHKTLTESWRKVRGRRWRALRERLGELAGSVPPPAVADQGAAAVEPLAAPQLAVALSLEQTPDSDPRALKH